MANLQSRADFIYQNLQIQQNVIGESFRHGVQKLLFLGSTCIYPREAPQPMTEDCLLTSPLEYTNEPYAIAKIAGLKMCESFNLQYGTNYIAVMPTNLYGPNDNFHLENSHVLPAMIRKIYRAKCLNEGDWQAVRRDLDLRPSCYDCAFKSAGREADLTLADYWGVKKAQPDFFDGKGTSLLLVHSEKGERLRAHIAPALRMTATDLDRALAANPAADRSVACPPGRTAFFAVLDSRTIAEQADTLCRDSAATKAKNLLRRAVNKLRG